MTRNDDPSQSEDKWLLHGFKEALQTARIEQDAHLTVSSPARSAPTSYPGSLSSQIEVTANIARDTASLLADAVRYGTVRERRLAHLAIAEIIHTLVEPDRGRVIPKPHSFSAVSRLEDRLKDIRLRIPRVPWSPVVQRAWTALGLLISLAAAAAMISGHFLSAFLFVGMRAAVSLTMDTPGFASDTRGNGRWRLAWKACAVGHVSDALVLSSVSGYLLVEGMTVWGLVAALVPIGCLGSTLIRVAASQGGIVLGRLYLERVARNGVLILGILSAAVIGGGAHTVLPALLLACSGAAAYSVVELVRTFTYSSGRMAEDRLVSPGEAFARRVANVVPLVDAAIADTSALRQAV